MTCHILSHLPVRSHVCTRPALCGSHASRIVWPAFTPASKPALAVALAPAPARPARPRLGAGCPFRLRRLPRTGRPRACLPLRPFPPVSPERGGASCLPRPANRLSSCRQYARLAAPQTRDPARASATVGRSLPAVRACQVWGLGVQHRRRDLDDCPPFSLEICGWAKAAVFF